MTCSCDAQKLVSEAMKEKVADGKLLREAMRGMRQDRCVLCVLLVLLACSEGPTCSLCVDVHGMHACCQMV